MRPGSVAPSSLPTYSDLLQSQPSKDDSRAGQLGNDQWDYESYDIPPDTDDRVNEVFAAPIHSPTQAWEEPSYSVGNLPITSVYGAPEQPIVESKNFSYDEIMAVTSFFVPDDCHSEKDRENSTILLYEAPVSHSVPSQEKLNNLHIRLENEENYSKSAETLHEQFCSKLSTEEKGQLKKHLNKYDEQVAFSELEGGELATLLRKIGFEVTSRNTVTNTDPEAQIGVMYTLPRRASIVLQNEFPHQPVDSSTDVDGDDDYIGVMETDFAIKDYIDVESVRIGQASLSVTQNGQEAAHILAASVRAFDSSSPKQSPIGIKFCLDDSLGEEQKSLIRTLLILMTREITQKNTVFKEDVVLKKDTVLTRHPKKTAVTAALGLGLIGFGIAAKWIFTPASSHTNMSDTTGTAEMKNALSFCSSAMLELAKENITASNNPFAVTPASLSTVWSVVQNTSFVLATGLTTLPSLALPFALYKQMKATCTQPVAKTLNVTDNYPDGLSGLRYFDLPEVTLVCPTKLVSRAETIPFTEFGAKIGNGTIEAYELVKLNNNHLIKIFKNETLVVPDSNGTITIPTDEANLYSIGTNDYGTTALEIMVTGVGEDDFPFAFEQKCDITFTPAAGPVSYSGASDYHADLGEWIQTNFTAVTTQSGEVIDGFQLSNITAGLAIQEQTLNGAWVGVPVVNGNATVSAAPLRFYSPNAGNYTLSVQPCNNYSNGALSDKCNYPAQTLELDYFYPAAESVINCPVEVADQISIIPFASYVAATDVMYGTATTYELTGLFSDTLINVFKNNTVVSPDSDGLLQIPVNSTALYAIGAKAYGSAFLNITIKGQGYNGNPFTSSPTLCAINFAPVPGPASCTGIFFYTTTLGNAIEPTITCAAQWIGQVVDNIKFINITSNLQLQTQTSNGAWIDVPVSQSNAIVASSSRFRFFSATASNNMLGIQPCENYSNNTVSGTESCDYPAQTLELNFLMPTMTTTATPAATTEKPTTTVSVTTTKEPSTTTPAATTEKPTTIPTTTTTTITTTEAPPQIHFSCPAIAAVTQGNPVALSQFTSVVTVTNAQVTGYELSGFGSGLQLYNNGVAVSANGQGQYILSTTNVSGYTLVSSQSGNVNFNFQVMYKDNDGNALTSTSSQCSLSFNPTTTTTTTTTSTTPAATSPTMSTAPSLTTCCAALKVIIDGGACPPVLNSCSLFGGGCCSCSLSSKGYCACPPITYGAAGVFIAYC